MEEKIYTTKKNGMLALVLIIAGYLVAALLSVAGPILTGGFGWFLSAIAIVYMALGWILFLGLKVLKPQEALVLTLFGKYKGTIKEDGFYFVNPFCGSFNPAATTKLNQSGDVDTSAATILTAAATGTTPAAYEKCVSIINTINLK